LFFSAAWAQWHQTRADHLFFIDEREQFLGGLGITLLNAVEDLG